MTHRHEPGVAYYEFAKSVDEPDTYVVVEVYGDIEIHARHMASAWVKESLPKSARLIAYIIADDGAQATVYDK